MIPLSLRLRNFMSYGEDVPPLDFSRITTACLTGDNGHGKSALLDAITWALWGQTRAKNLDDIVRLGQDEAEVEIVFELEDDRYRVLRKRSRHTRAGQSALELQGFDKATQRYRALSGNTIRETEAKIVQLLHMNYDTFINSVFILQGRADEFTTRRPGERKRILAEILGLATFDELEARARARRGELDQEVKLHTQRLSELQQEVARKPELARGSAGPRRFTGASTGRTPCYPGASGTTPAAPQCPGSPEPARPGCRPPSTATTTGTPGHRPAHGSTPPAHCGL